jgi:hypothetical protein
VRAGAASLLAVLAALVFAASSSPGAGRAEKASTRARGTPAAYFPGTGTWYEIDHGHLVVGRAGGPRWRSAGLFPSRFRLGVVAASRRGVAFSYHGWLYIAKAGGAERRVAPHEGAVGWTADGVYTYGKTLLLRSDTGHRISTLVRKPQQHAYDPTTGALDLVDDGNLIVARGARLHRAASLRTFNLPPRATQLIPLGGLIELESANRIVILRSDGALFASTPLARDATVSSGLAVAPRRRAVAFTIALGENGTHSRGSETVYLLRAGSEHAVPIHTQRVAFRPCERGATVTWHGHWLYYNNSEGNRATVDAAAPHRATRRDE